MATGRHPLRPTIPGHKNDVRKHVDYLIIMDIQIFMRKKWMAERDRLAVFLPRIVPMNRAVAPSPGPSGHPLPVGDDCMDARLYGWRR